MGSAVVVGGAGPTVTVVEYAQGEGLKEWDPHMSPPTLPASEVFYIQRASLISSDRFVVGCSNPFRFFLFLSREREREKGEGGGGSGAEESGG